MSRDRIEYDVLVVGAGPAGLMAAIRIKQLAKDQNRDISVCVLEKGAQVGAHILSGAVIDPVVLNQYLPNWKAESPLKTKVKEEAFHWLSEDKSFEIPNSLLPPLMRNKEAYVGSLGDLCRWLSDVAEQLGVEIYSGFSASAPLIENKQLIGVVTGDMGRSKSGGEGPNFSAGMEIVASYTLLAEGARGSITLELEKLFQLRSKNAVAQFGLGLKEVWRIPSKHHHAGAVHHFMGWPLKNETGGGGFLYHYGENKVAVGFVVHLNYQDPYLSPFEEFQRFKTHPSILSVLEGAEQLAYGARAISEGGIEAWPQLAFPGGLILGCAAGVVNVPRIKGVHNAMFSGVYAAEAVFSALVQKRKRDVLSDYMSRMQNGEVAKDLKPVRNVKPYLSRFGTLGGTLLGGAEMWLFAAGITMPHTLRHAKPDHETLREAQVGQVHADAYSKPDGKITLSKENALVYSQIHHDDAQPNHLLITDIQNQWQKSITFASPETRYCPAGVYMVAFQGENPRLQIQSQNCLHCKTCDIKDPGQYIRWVPPEGGSGPNYQGM